MAMVFDRQALAGEIDVVVYLRCNDQAAGGVGYVDIVESMQRPGQQIGNHQEHSRNPARAAQATSSRLVGRERQTELTLLGHNEAIT